MADLLECGITDFIARCRGENEDDFLMWQDYRQDQALLKILENPKHNQLGTSYKDRFLSSDVFQWESIAYVGTDKLMNPRKGATANGSILYDIHMNQGLPDYLMDDFKWIA